MVAARTASRSPVASISRRCPATVVRSRVGLVLGVVALAMAMAAHDPPAATAAPAAAVSRTVQLGTNGSPTGPTKVMYSCSGRSPVCGPQIAPTGRWATTLTVPVETTVWIHAENTRPDASGTTPDCWISDQAGKQTYIQSSSGICVFQTAPLPLPPAPPSGR